MRRRVELTMTPRRHSLPYDFAAKILLAENLIKGGLYVMPLLRVQMYVDTTVISEELSE